jgi:hypothetical protein
MRQVAGGGRQFGRARRAVREPANRRSGAVNVVKIPGTSRNRA